jgi:hypothetical protein
MVYFADFALLKEAKRVLVAGGRTRAGACKEKNRPRGRFAFSVCPAISTSRPPAS